MHSYRYILIINLIYPNPLVSWYWSIENIFFSMKKTGEPWVKSKSTVKMKEWEIVGIHRNLRAAELDSRVFWFFISIKVLLFFQKATKFWKNEKTFITNITQKTQNKTKGFLYQNWQQRQPCKWWKFYLCSPFGHASRQCHPCQKTRM